MKQYKSVAAFLLVVLLVATMFGCGTTTQPAATSDAAEPSADASAASPEAEAATPAPLKVALLMSGSITDGGWNTNAYQGLMESADELGIEAAYSENVQTNDQLTLMRQYASKGYNFIIGNGFQYEDAATTCASEFPNVKFWVYGGTVTGENLASSQYWMGQCGYPCGVLMGLHTKSNKIGFVVGSEDPTTMSELRNMEAGALAYNANVKCTFSFTGDWSDIQKAKEAAYALIADGCDVIVCCLDAATTGVIEACVEKNVWLVNVTQDAYDLAPDNILTSSIMDGKVAMKRIIQIFVNGEFEGKVYRFGIADGVLYLGKFGNSVTDEEKAEVEKVFEQVKNGEIELISLT